MSIDAGTLNRKIAIDERTTTFDGANQEVNAWAVVLQPWASFRAPNGMSTIRASDPSVPIGPGRCSWRIRYRPAGITTSNRVTYQGVHYDIVDIRHDHATKEYTDLVCEVGAKDG